MAKPEWGAKRTCQNCGVRFYDLCRETIVCPVCSTVYDVDRQTRVRRGGVKEEVASQSKISKSAVAGEVDEDLIDETVDAVDDDDSEESETEGDGDDLDDLNTEGQDLMEDTSDLGEDGDDIGEVMEHIDEEIEDKS